MGDPFLDISGRELLADAVERAHLAALPGHRMADGTLLGVVDRFTLLDECGVLRRRRGRRHHAGDKRQRHEEPCAFSRERHHRTSKMICNALYQRYLIANVAECAVYGRYTYPRTSELGCTMLLMTLGS